jgi:hypothetical protein
MRFTSALPPVLLLSLTTSICAPIPVEECSHYASCTRSVRPSQQSTTQRPKDSSPLQEPHFPTHQLEFSRHADTVEVRLLEPPVTRPDTAIQPEPPIRNPKLNAVLKAAHKDKASAKKKPHELGHKSSSTKGTEVIPAISKTQSPSPKDPDVRKYSFTTSMLKKLQLVASTSRKCGLMDGTAEAEHKHGDGKMTITYTYGYSYIRTDYSSVLVVSIVAIFMLAIIVVELLDKVIEA